MPRKLLQGVLLAIGAVLNIGIVVLGFFLFRGQFENRPVEEKKITLPNAESKELWDELRPWTVQSEGRVKPFGTFCIETVRAITGREKFQKRDPVALVWSWMMTFRPQGEQRDDQLMLKIGKKLDCYWDKEAFILCDHLELREKIYRETAQNKDEPTPEQLHGKYIEPWRLHSSPTMKELMRQVRTLRGKDEKAPLTMLQTKAQEVQGCLTLFERTRSGAEFGAVVLDKVGNTWFPLAAMLSFADPNNELTMGDRKITASLRWDDWLDQQRRRHPETYKGNPVQAYPEAGVKKVAAAFTAAREAYVTQDEDKLRAANTTLLNTIEAVSKENKSNYPETTTTNLELTFNKVVPFQKAWIFSLLAVMLLAVSVVVDRQAILGKVAYYGGLGSFIVSMGWAAYGFICRVSISGRPPVSDMYETIIWVSAITSLFGLILELIYRRGYIALAATLVSTLGFVLADQLPNTFSPNIKPLSAVLRSQFWLIVHVITIVSSYAAFALAWGLGNLNIGLILWAPGRKEQIKTLSHYSYKAIQIGVILLFTGTMLGGWWAAESWGRFWGWDPKEVWALIAFLAYIIPLHARYVGWVKDFGLAACSVICFAFVVGAWYGVNFIFGVGLHSYGFGAGNNWWLYWAGLINVSLVLHAGLRYLSKGGDLATEEG
jgi:ABC-type transport system involved in cytochrome c biogenesis permease subunit